jgi:hypothetical protein
MPGRSLQRDVGGKKKVDHRDTEAQRKRSKERKIRR